MYKKAYKYFGILALLWTYSSGTIEAVGLLDEHKAPEAPQSKERQRYTALIDAHTKFAKAYKKATDKAAHRNLKPKKKIKKRKAVMVIGTLPNSYLAKMGRNGALASYDLSSLEDFNEIYDKYLGGLDDDKKKDWNQSYEESISVEGTFMGNTYCDERYVQYVTRPYHLPNLYVAEEDSEKPIYIVVPFAQELVNNIFYYSTVGNFGVFDLERKGRAGYRERMDESIALLNAYMQEVVYPLMDIKAVVINYDGTKVMHTNGSIQEDELVKLGKIDLMIRSFGTLLYSEKNGRYTINPQVFWINWHKNFDGPKDNAQKKGIYCYKNKKEKFYVGLITTWFQVCSEYKWRQYRQTSLLYPFVRLHAPAIADYVRDKNTTWYNYNLIEYKKLYAYMPHIPLADKNRPQMVLLNIDDTLLSKQKQKKPEVFTHIVQAVKNVPSSIPYDRFRFWVAIRYSLLQILAKREPNGPEDNGLKREMNKFLCKQNDMPAHTLNMPALKQKLNEIKKIEEKYIDEENKHTSTRNMEKKALAERLETYEAGFNTYIKYTKRCKKKKTLEPEEHDNNANASLVSWDAKYTNDEHKYDAGNGFGGLYTVGDENTRDKNNLPPHSKPKSSAFAGLTLDDAVGPSIFILVSLCTIVYVYNKLKMENATDKVPPSSKPTGDPLGTLVDQDAASKAAAKEDSDAAKPKKQPKLQPAGDAIGQKSIKPKPDKTSTASTGGDGSTSASPPPSPEKPEVPDNPSEWKAFWDNFLHHFFFMQPCSWYR